MKAKSTLFVTVTVLLFAAACGPKADPAPPSTVVDITPALLESGHETYRLNCVPCHGPEGRGDGPSAASLNPKPRDHSDPALMEGLTDKKIAETVRMGGAISGFPNMPASPHIKGDELIGLIAFVRSLHRDEILTVDVEGVGQDGS